MLDPYVRAESASLTVQLSELPAFAAVAPARQDAVNLVNQTTGVRKVRAYGSIWSEADHQQVEPATTTYAQF